ncbi:MAG: AtpZ/AtpI family protein [Thermoanaerobaculales bacterium]|jgi:ATP synthase protein I|nr:AtpZ/AtpI family protein [Thermoanaerobaculales bacterium]
MGRGKKQLRRARLWLDVSIVGVQFPVAIVLGYFFGRWLDGMFNTRPWMTMIFALFGIAAGFVNLFRITAQAGRAEDEIEKLETDEDGKPGDDPGNS